MINLDFELTFESDWHVSSGSGDGQADSILERGLNGIPFIGGSTLKGLFRDALTDLGNLPYVGEPELVNNILGSAVEESPWTFSSATAQLAQDNRPGQFSQVVAGVRVQPHTRRAEEGKFYQREMASAEIKFEFSITGNGDQTQVEWLAAAAAYIRQLGGRRRRGAGNCQIRLKDPALHEALLAAIETRLVNQQLPAAIPLPTVNESYQSDESVDSKRFRVLLRVDTPLVIASKAEAGNNFHGQLQIPARALRGALGQRADGKYTSELFLKFFIQGGVVFDNLTPLIPAGNAAEVLDSMPMGLKKVPETLALKSILGATNGEGKSAKGYLVLPNKRADTVKRGKEVIQLDRVPKLKTRLHVEIDPQTKRSRTGNLYSYEAIPAGQHYIGELRLKPDVQWADFAGLAGINRGEAFQLSMGKGRRRGYGHCTIWIEPLDESEPPLWCLVPLEDRLNVIQANQLYLTLASDTIVLDDWGRAPSGFTEEILKSIFPDAQRITIRDQVARSRLVDSFDLRSGLPYWRDSALVKGSTVLFEITPFPTLEELRNLEDKSVGLRRSEGFGRVIFNHPAHTMPTDSIYLNIEIPVSSSQSYLAEWQAYLGSEFKPNHLFDTKTKSNVLQAFRAFARTLLEHPQMTKVGLIDKYDRLTKPKAKADKNEKASNPDFKASAQKHIEELLDVLETYPLDFWQLGCAVLAEQILDAVKEMETFKKWTKRKG